MRWLSPAVVVTGGAASASPRSASPSPTVPAMSAAAAVCEIDGCGVIALGRCSLCGEAFCASHRDPMRPGDRQFFQHPEWLCAPCAPLISQDLLAQQEQKRRANIEAERQSATATAEAAAEIRSMTAQVLAALKAAGYPGAVKRERRKGLFGKVQEPWAYRAHHGYEWEHDPEGSKQVWVRRYITLDGRPIRPNGEPDESADPLDVLAGLYRDASNYEGIRVPIPAAVRAHPNWPEGLR